MGYEVVLTPSAEKDFGDLSQTMRQRVLDALDALAVDPRSHKCAKLKGDLGYRTKAGDYRIRYQINDRAKVVTVYKIGPRRDVYRD